MNFGSDNIPRGSQIFPRFCYSPTNWIKRKFTTRWNATDMIWEPRRSSRKIGPSTRVVSDILGQILALIRFGSLWDPKSMVFLISPYFHIFFTDHTVISGRTAPAKIFTTYQAFTLVSREGKTLYRSLAETKKSCYLLGLSVIYEDKSVANGLEVAGSVHYQWEHQDELVLAEITIKTQKSHRPGHLWLWVVIRTTRICSFWCKRFYLLI